MEIEVFNRIHCKIAQENTLSVTVMEIVRQWDNMKQPAAILVLPVLLDEEYWSFRYCA